MTDSLPIVAISMGDPSGIGPEIAVRAADRDAVRAICRPVIVGDAGVIHRAAGVVGSRSNVNAVGSIAQCTFLRGVIDVIDQETVHLDRLRVGEVDAMSGHAAFEAVRKLIALASSGDVNATVTAPIHKEALHKAGHFYPGHTEIFAAFTDTRDFTMMLAVGDFRVVHVSTHVSLRQACDAVSRDRVRAVIQLAHDACVDLGIASPRVGVAGLNPHASDGGLFGDEERLHISPAIDDAKSAGIRVDGPHPPDTFFAKAAGGAWDVVVAMYHDQGHIPAKMRGFEFDAKSSTWTRVDGINVSLGLPIVRVSVDHGTAFDQAGKGTARDTSMVQAIEYAAKLAAKRNRKRGSN